MGYNGWYKNSSQFRSNQFSIYDEVESSYRPYEYHKTGYYFYHSSLLAVVIKILYSQDTTKINL